MSVRVVFRTMGPSGKQKDFMVSCLVSITAEQHVHFQQTAFRSLCGFVCGCACVCMCRVMQGNSRSISSAPPSLRASVSEHVRVRLWGDL